ncbi:MAG: TetR/AcrR family transcriptional regulator C-terminal domain-containing protein, partial [Stellaceae bacterium]
HAKIEEYFARQSRLGALRIPDVRRAADYFWGMLLHHGTLRRLYNVVPPPRSAVIKADSIAVVDEFLSRYGDKAAEAVATRHHDSA